MTSEDQLLTAIRTQGLSPARAEELFALDVGPLPGVSMTGVASNKWFDGTEGVLAVQSEWASLTKAIQNAALKLISSSKENLPSRIGSRCRVVQCPAHQQDDRRRPDPGLNRDIENLQVVLQTVKYHVPGLAADINTVVMDNQQYMYWLAAAYRSSEQPGEANVGSDISTAVALDTASGPDFVRLRADLGLPPPSTG
jgi:hypothetical protein